MNQAKFMGKIESDKTLARDGTEAREGEVGWFVIFNYELSKLVKVLPE